MLTHGIPLPRNRPECHKKVYFILFNCDDNDLKSIATELNDLRESRNIADYDMDERGSDRETARSASREDSRVIARFDNLCGDHARMSGARVAMTHYAQETQRLS